VESCQRDSSDGGDWRHIPGESNPADLPSRGCSAKQLLASRWWKGPSWLKLAEPDWPISKVQCDLDIVLSEKKKSVVSQLAVPAESNWYIGKFSKFRKAVRMVSWILRWRCLLKLKTFGPLHMKEERLAELYIVRLVQEEVFHEGDRVLKQLNAVKDDFGIWRVQTKILMREDFRNFKFPMILPNSHPVTRMIIEQHHQLNGHCGIQVLMGTLREKFWIVKASKIVRQIINSCGRCRRYTVQKVNPVAAPLPLDRVRDAEVFEVIGIDLGGPMYLKDKQKAWFVVFTCSIYRAVHLELITSLSTEAFMQGLRRFIARRGCPCIIYSDNGTNFEGTSNALKKLDWQKITEETSVHQILWKFIPPLSPWWGGFWECIVGMVKKLLRRILGRASLEYEELQTVLFDCEQIIDSRPLTYISEDSADLVPLTPSTFLLGKEKCGVPDLDIVEAEGFKKRYAYRQKLRQDLRTRFRAEYLAYLVQRNPIKTNNQSVKVGDVVLVSNDNKKRIDWPLAQIIELFPGKDGIVRTVRLKTAMGEMTRSIQRVYPLEVSGQAEEDALIVGKAKPIVAAESLKKPRKPGKDAELDAAPRRKLHFQDTGDQ